MSAAKHTPGPWQVLPQEEDVAYLRVRGTQLGCRYKVSNVLVPTYADLPEREWAETQANARLIAAAPEGFDIIEALEESFTADDAYQQFLPAMRAYLAKVRGQA